VTTWVELLRDASLDWRPPMSPLEWEDVKSQTAELPPDLRTLYGAVNGIKLPAGLRLFPLRGAPGEASTLRYSREPVPGLGTAGIWRFGRMGEKVHLFAVQKRKIHGRADGAPLPTWLQAVSDDAWVYGFRNESSFQTRLFHSLAAMLHALLPDRLVLETPPPAPAALPGSIEVDLASDDSVEVELDIAVEEPSVEVLDEADILQEVSPPPPPGSRKKKRPAKPRARGKTKPKARVKPRKAGKKSRRRR
jgi:hypothetical protein